MYIFTPVKMYKLTLTLTIEDTHGTKKTIEPGGVIPIVKGLKISFSGNVVGEIKIKE